MASKKPLKLCRKHKIKGFSKVNMLIIQYTFIIPYWRLQVKHFRAEKSLKIAGLSLLNGLVWGINIPTKYINLYIRCMDNKQD